MRILAILTTSAALLAAGPVAAESTSSYAAEARGMIQQLSTSLLGELGTALADGGPVNAIGFCQTRAPAIAAEVSDGSDWTVGRTSDRIRNPANAPDLWEQRVLAQFQSRKDAGESLAGMRYAEVVDADGRLSYRYMQAIPLGEPCLACHGSTLDPALVEAIDKAYPEDQARGYAAGDLRGAFTLQRPL